MRDDKAGSKPIFVIGSYRSGTSIFAWCLGQHPNIVNLPETNWIYRLSCDMERLYSYGTCNGRFSHLSQMGMSKEDFYAEFGQRVAEFIDATKIRLNGTVGSYEDGETLTRRFSENEPKNRWVDATPENSHHVFGLLRLFPDAKFIHLLREPDQVARSLMKFENAGGSNYTLKGAYETWLRLTKASVFASMAYGSEKVLRINYDDLLKSPKNVFRVCLEFLGEEYCEKCESPLSQKINSSMVDDIKTLPRSGWQTGKIQKKARQYYREILSIHPEAKINSACVEKLRNEHEHNI